MPDVNSHALFITYAFCQTNVVYELLHCSYGSFTVKKSKKEKNRYTVGSGGINRES